MPTMEELALAVEDLRREQRDFATAILQKLDNRESREPAQAPEPPPTSMLSRLVQPSASCSTADPKSEAEASAGPKIKGWAAAAAKLKNEREHGGGLSRLASLSDVTVDDLAEQTVMHGSDHWHIERANGANGAKSKRVSCFEPSCPKLGPWSGEMEA